MKSTNIKLLLCGCTIAIVGALGLEGCSSSDSPSGTGGGTSSGGTSSGGKGGTSSGGASTGGTSSGGAAAGGTSSGGTAAGGTSSGGASSGGTSSAGTGGASGSTSSGGAGAGGTGTAGTAGTGGMGGTGGTGVDCTTFCNDEETICKFGAMDMAPYTNKGACMTACMNMTPGDVGVYPAGPMSGDTFACRRWHLSKAGDTGPVATHCPHTSVPSKAMYTDNSATGPCK